MKLEIPSSYPNDLTNNEIQKFIEKSYEEVTKYSRSNAIVGSSYYMSIIQLGQVELNQRIQKAQILGNKNAKVINRWLSGVTIVLALVTLYIGTRSLSFAQLDQESDDKWRDSQLEMLRNNNSELMKTNQELTKMNTELKNMSQLLQEDLSSNTKKSK